MKIFYNELAMLYSSQPGADSLFWGIGPVKN